MVTALSFSVNNKETMIHFITDSLVLGVNLRTQSTIQVIINQNLREKIPIKIFPSLDPITGQPKPILTPISQKYSIAQFSVKPSGMNVETRVAQGLSILDFSEGEELRVGLSEYFQGYFLEYTIQCEFSDLCEEGGAIQVKGSSILQEINLEKKLKATRPQQVFQYKEWIVLINDVNLFTGIRMDSTYSESETETLVDMRRIELTHIRTAYSFKENFGSDQYYYFWVI